MFTHNYISSDRYFTLPKEIDAMIQGMYLRAKKSKTPFVKVVDDYLDSLMGDGIIDAKGRAKIYKTWKERIPKIGGIPTLK